MTAQYLLDTNIVSEPFRRAPSPRLMARWKRHGAVLATAAPVWHELIFGMRRLPASSRRAALERYLAEIGGALPVLPYDQLAAAWHAEERSRLFKQQPPFVDGQIAAVAAVNSLVLVTANVADYRRFRDLSIENWFE